MVPAHTFGEALYIAIPSANQEYPATGSRVEAAPECVSVVFDEESGLCTRMTGGFCLDRGSGNTGPAGGIWGVMQVDSNLMNLLRA